MGKKKGKSGRAAKRARQSLACQETDDLVKAPHSFVIYRGKLGRNCGDLMHDFRKVMEPFTASELKIRKGNVVKDFVSIAGMLNVTHLIVFTKTQVGAYVRIARLPRGPTLTFQIKNYSLAKDVLSTLKKRVTYAKQFAHHPLLVLNNFSGDGKELKLMSSMLQNMFPSINVNKINLNTIRRCVLFNYNPDDKTVEFRHYTIKAVPCGVSKAVKKLIQSRVPDLSKFEDVSEFIQKSGNLSESEAEMDGPINQVILPQNLSSRGNMASQKSAIRLIELGPRMTLQLIKVEEGLMEGEVLYHTHVKKTREEIEVTKLQRQKNKKLKLQRREKQEENKRQKEEEKSQHKEKCLQGMKKDPQNEEAASEEDSEDDDAKWYEQELGEKPDADLFPSRKRKSTLEKGPAKKKQRTGPPKKKQRTGPARKTLQSGSARKTQQSGPARKKQQSGSAKNKQRTGPARKTQREESRNHGEKDERKKRTRSLQEILKKRKHLKEKRKKKAVTSSKTTAVRKHIKMMKNRA